jgi:xanthine dehydrogenase accessory factor
MHGWLTDLQQLLAHGDAVVLVTVARVEGSAPRAPGTKMIVTRDSARHTIGGGDLEWRAIDIARQVLRDSAHRVPRRLERLALGVSLGQCGGGAVTLAFERLTIADLGWVTSLAKRVAARQPTVRSVSFGPNADSVMLSEPEPDTARDDCLLWDGAGFAGSGALMTETIASRPFDVVLFGAGHVGAALVRVLTTLRCVITWVDSRDAQFSGASASAGVLRPAGTFQPAGTSQPAGALQSAGMFAPMATLAPHGTACTPNMPIMPGLRRAPNLVIDENDAPLSAVDAAPPNAYFVVMTHHHTMDQELAEGILRRGDYAYFGMIGSKSKRKHFEHRLAARGIDPAQIARMTCPIGVEGITDKAPESIAVAVAAQLLRVVEQRAAASHPASAASPPAWRA